MYSGPMCAFCDAAKRLLKRNNLEFKEIDISTQEKTCVGDAIQFIDLTTVDGGYISSWNWNPSILTLLATLVAEIVISSSAVMLILAVPAPEFSEIISRVLSVAEFTL